MTPNREATETSAATTKVRADAAPCACAFSRRLAGAAHASPFCRPTLSGKKPGLRFFERANAGRLG